MRFQPVLIAMLTLSFAASIAAAAAPSAAPIDKWIKELCAEDFSTRRAAETSLQNAGDAAQGSLEKASQSTDPEIKLRASRLLSTRGVEPILQKMEAAA